MPDLEILINERYLLTRKLGQGGMGEVYLADDTTMQRQVALKFIHGDLGDPGSYNNLVERFKREAGALAALSHPNIIHVHDYGEYDGRPYLVMEYLPGGTLADRMGTPLPWQEACRLLLPVAKALEYAHAEGILHRDIKPQNILFTKSGEPMVADFGLARVIDPEGESGTGSSTASLSLIGAAPPMGTPTYMAPEQWAGKATAQSDVYSLGVVLFELLTGKVPYPGKTPGEVVTSQIVNPLPRPRELNPSIPIELERVVLKALARDPSQRYINMEKFVDQLQFVDRQEIKKTFPDSQIEPITQITRKHELSPGVYLEFVFVPAGKFLMGSPNWLGEEWEHPQHEVYLDEYWIGKYPITNRQFITFLRESGQEIDKELLMEDQLDHPVVKINQIIADEFCRWASKKTNRIIRLPTEAEWEKAAHGQSPRLYPWGDEEPDKIRCNFNNYYKKTTPVDYFSPGSDSPYGCADMAGNIWEWVNDVMDLGESYYYRSPEKNPTGEDIEKGYDYNVQRGGSWKSGKDQVRTTFRKPEEPIFARDDAGFRCALSSTNENHGELTQTFQLSSDNSFTNSPKLIESKYFANTQKSASQAIEIGERSVDKKDFKNFSPIKKFFYIIALIILGLLFIWFFIGATFGQLF